MKYNNNMTCLRNASLSEGRTKLSGWKSNSEPWSLCGGLVAARKAISQKAQWSQRSKTVRTFIVFIVRAKRSLRPIHLINKNKHKLMLQIIQKIRQNNTNQLAGKWLIFCKQFSSFICVEFWCLDHSTVQFFSNFSNPARLNAFRIQIRSQWLLYPRDLLPITSRMDISARFIPNSGGYSTNIEGESPRNKLGRSRKYPSNNNVQWKWRKSK